MIKKTPILITGILILIFLMGSPVMGSYNKNTDIVTENDTVANDTVAENDMAAKTRFAGNSSLFRAGIISQDPISKEALSPAQKKLSTDLLQLSNEKFLLSGQTHAALKAQMKELGQLKPAENLSSFPTGSERNVYKTAADTEDRAYVYVYVNSSASTHVLDPYCEVTDRDEENHIAVAWVKVESLEMLAALPEVRSVQTVTPPVTNCGNVETEGDFILNSSALRVAYGISGAGMKIGIISDGVDNLATAQRSGDLPPDVHVLRNKDRPGGDEGTAMLEIVHDIAPDAELYFHDCGDNVLEFNAAIDALVNAGCTVVCDDISWLTEPFFEDGIIASHVREVIKNRDILYVSSAGNDAASHYQGTFYDGSNGWHDFSGGTHSDFKDLYVKLPPGRKITVVLEWNDKWGKSSNDYDLYLWDESSGANVDVSNKIQDGNDQSYEIVECKNSGFTEKNLGISVYKHRGDSRVLEVFLFTDGLVYSNNLVPKDSIFGHPAVPEVVSVGAINANDNGNDEIESFSSLGPVTIAYPVPETRKKPDICGIDGVSVTGAGGFSNPFFGTSASAPHVAALAALVWSAYPGKSNEEIKGLLYSSAYDLGTPGYDTIFGYGRADALGMYRIEATKTVASNGTGDFKSIQDAVNHSRVGNTILVYPGIYKENLDVRVGLTIASVSGNAKDTIIQAADPDEPVFNVSTTSVKISGFTVKGAESAQGIYLNNAGNCTLENNTVSNNLYGIYLYNTTGSSLRNNSIQDNIFGTYLEESGNNKLRKNSMLNNTYNFGARGNAKNLQNDIDLSNTVDGKAIYYLVNASDKAADIFKNAGTIYAVDCRNVSIEGQTLKNNLYGIYLCNTTGSSLRNNSIQNNQFGIYLEESGNNTLRKNSMLNNTYNFGAEGNAENLHNDIDLSNTVDGKAIYYLVNASDKAANIFKNAGTIYAVDCRNVSIEGQTPKKNLFGIYLCNTTDSSLRNNTLSENILGIYLKGAGNNTLDGNKVSKNMAGLMLEGSFRNRVCRNEFENKANIKEKKASELQPNIWNSTGLIRYLYNGNVYSSYFGNFYSDYIGPDADKNKIGDTPYGSDSYPLIDRPGKYLTGFAIGSLKPAKNTGSIEGDVLSFEVKSTRGCNFSWLINGIPIEETPVLAQGPTQAQVSGTESIWKANTSEILEKVPEASPDTPFTATYNVSVIARTDSETLQHSWNWTIFRTDEARDKVKEVLVPLPLNISKNESVAFNFTAADSSASSPEESGIYGVSFKALEEPGSVSARLETLRENPAGAKPAGDLVYRYLNLEFNNSSISESENIQNRTVAFKVPQVWIRENNINAATISLQRYHKGTWNQLKAAKEEGKDPNYAYFKAETPGFSSFAITASRIISRSGKGGGSGGSSRGGGGGGGGSPEPAGNVEFKELAQSFITCGAHVRFEFVRNVTAVTCVEFDSKKSAGKTTTIVEMLKNRSVLVSSLPEGVVYRNINIWVGNGGFATSQNIENAKVGFRVEKTWLSANGIEPESIALNRYDGKNWTRLETKKTGEDSNSLYFEAGTPEFASFSITGLKKESLKKEIVPISQKTDKSQATARTGQKNTKVKSPADEKKAPVISFMGAVLLVAGAIYSRKKMKV